MAFIGKHLRSNRIFNQLTGKTMLVAMDHAQSRGPIRGLIKPIEAIRKVVAGDIDGILTTYGMMYACYKEFSKDVALILRIDGGQTLVAGTPMIHRVLVRSIKDVVKLGADGVGMMGFIGSDRDEESHRQIGEIASQCEEYGVTLMVETIPVAGSKFKDPYSVDAVKQAARMCAELGADIIKTYYTGSPESFREVTDGCYVPIVMLGGVKMENERQVLGVARGGIDGGAAGICFGRNIWQHKNPTALLKALSKIVHKDYSIEKAEIELSRTSNSK